MFDYVGNKLQLVGKIVAWLGIGMSAVYGFSLFATVPKAENGFLTAMGGIAVILIGALLSWVAGLFIIGFGELVENSTELKRDFPREEQFTSNLGKIAEEVEEKSKDGWVCPNCQSNNDKMALQCKNCGRYR